MLTIRLTKVLGTPPEPAVSATFYPPGGTIGRGSECTLVLPDPHKHVSRLQARVEIAGGSVAIRCTSHANPLYVAGEPLEDGQVALVHDGDTITVAGFEMVAAILASAMSAARPAPPPVVVPMAADFDPFADLEPSGSPSATPPARVDRFDGFDDLDGFGQPAGQGQGQAPAASSGGRGESPFPGADLQPDLGRSITPAESIDALFDLGSAGSDPFAAGAALASTNSTSITAGDVDPLESLSQQRRSTPARAEDERGDPLQDALRLPDAGPLPVTPNPPAGVPQRSSRVPSPPRFRTPESPPGSSPSTPSGEGAFHDPALATTFTRPTSFVENANQQHLEAMSRDRPQRPAGTDRRGGEADASLLLQGLLQGVGLHELPNAPGQPGGSALTPAMMVRIGQLLQISLQGVVELLQARAVLKQEMRVDRTLVAASNNNPLKFAPNAQAAVTHMLSQQKFSGFLEPVPAMRDAYDDLLAHQLGMVAGLRAALNNVIGRFAPTQLEERLSPKSMLDSLLPNARKARLWELFTERFEQLTQEAEDDFDAIFGEAFTKAYEEQVERLKSRDSAVDALGQPIGPRNG